MIRRPPRSTRTDTRFPYTTLFRSTAAIERNCMSGGPIFVYTISSDGIHLKEYSINDREIPGQPSRPRSEEHTSELQSLMRTSYAVFCLKKKSQTKHLRCTHLPSKNQKTLHYISTTRTTTK